MTFKPISYGVNGKHVCFDIAFEWLGMNVKQNGTDCHETCNTRRGFTKVRRKVRVWCFFDMGSSSECIAYFIIMLRTIRFVCFVLLECSYCSFIVAQFTPKYENNWPSQTKYGPFRGFFVLWITSKAKWFEVFTASGWISPFNWSKIKIWLSTNEHIILAN